MRYPASSPCPVVTVVMPAWNVATYVRQAVDSVLRQSLTDLEVVVVDDGSTDSTVEVVHAFTDARVRLLTQNNRGPSAARNRGCRAARASKYIAFLDADDCWDSDKLERQIAYLEARPECGAVGSLFRYISSTGRPVGFGGHVVTAADRERIACGEFYPFPAMSTIVVCRDVMERVGEFDEALGRIGSEDLDFMARLAQATPIGTVPAVLGSYRIHPNSAMSRERRRINQGARFVRRRLAARRAGGDLTWERFSATSLGWRERQQDAVEWCYRSTALWVAERRLLRAVLYGVMAILVNPRYTLRRVYRQRFNPAALTASKGRS